jgi:excisionase family DNA binding protein
MDSNQPMTALVSAIAAEVVKQIEPRIASLTPNVIRPALLTVKQAGAYLGRSEQSIQHLIFERQLPVVRYGRRVHLRRSDLDKWIDSNSY